MRYICTGSAAAVAAASPALASPKAAAAESRRGAPDTCTAGVDQLVEHLSRLALSEGISVAAPADAEAPFGCVPVLTCGGLEGVAELIRSSRAKRIVLMVGAGISTSACIPDFRTPGTGLYSQLQTYQLPYPEAVFSLGYFRQNPKAFYLLAKELYPGRYQPTPTHHFIRLLHNKGLLLRCFSQNIDGLERVAGLPPNKLVAAHGSFDAAHCIDCGRSASIYAVQEAIFGDTVPHCNFCNGLVKPDIVFFGEQLPGRFHRQRAVDLPRADLLVVMGTSLVVQPFAGMIDDVNEDVPRLLINRERVGERRPSPSSVGTTSSSSSSDADASCSDGEDGSSGTSSDSDDGSDCIQRSGGLEFEEDDAAPCRDAAWLGNCDAGCRRLAALLGWEQELDALIAAGEAAAAAAAAEEAAVLLAEAEGDE